MFINSSSSIGLILNAGTTSLTGSMIASILLILIMIIIILFMFGVPIEFGSLILFPFILAIASEYSNFMIILVAIILYMSILIAKNWIFR